MAHKRLTGFIALLFCTALLWDYAAARPSPEVGARAPGQRVTTGDSHSCVIEEDATVSCWGRNHHGQLGDGTTTDQPTPVPVVGLSNVVAISAGGVHRRYGAFSNTTHESRGPFARIKGQPFTI